MMQYSFILITIAAWAAAPILVRLGLEDGYSPMMGTVVGMVASAPVFYLLLRCLRQDGELRAPAVASAARYVVAAGLCNSLGMLANYVALNESSVAVAVAVSNINPLVALFLVLLFHRQERVAGHTVLGSVLVVLGIILVTAGT